MGGFSPTSPFAQATKNLGMDRPEVPAEAYDAFRNQYFNKRIAPRLHPSDREKQRETFLQRTQRPKMPTGEHLATLANLGLAEFEHTVAAPFVAAEKLVGGEKRGWKLPGEQKQLEGQMGKDRQKLSFTGQSGAGVADFAGGAAGYAVTLPAAERAVGAIGGKALGPIANFFKPGIAGAVKRSLAFGALQSLEAEPGKHASEFAKGTGWGIGGELVGATLGGLWKYFKGRKDLPSPKAVDDFIKEMARGEVSDNQASKDMDAALAESLHERAKSPGYLDGLSTSINDKQARPMATFVDEKGNKFASPLAKTPEKAFAQLKEAIESGRRVTHIEHDELDTELVNNVLSKLKQNYEPFSTTPTQIATNAVNEGIDAGGGTARMDEKVLSFRYAKAAPSKAEAERYIKLSGKGRVDDSLRDFQTVWNPFGNWMARSEAADRLQELGLTEIIPSPETIAKMRPSEGMNLPKVFKEKGWFDALDAFKGKENEPLDVRQKEHLTNSMKLLWDPAVPEGSAIAESALKTIKEYGLEGFLPKSRQALSEPIAGTTESYYQKVGRLAETLAKEKDPDLEYFYQQHGHQAVDAAMNMAGLMWEKAEGDLSKVKWSDEILRQGVEEGHLPSVDASIESSDADNLRKASLESRVLALAEQYNVDPRNIDRELLAQLDEGEIEHAKEISDAAKKSGVSVYDASMNEEARRLGIIGDDSAHMPKQIPPSELPSRNPGEPSGVAERQSRLPSGNTAKFSIRVKRAASGLPSRIYVLYNDAVKQELGWAGLHSKGLTVAKELKDAGFKGAAADLQYYANLSGIRLEDALVTVVHKPDSGFKKGYSADTLWHEDLHGILSQIGLVKAVEGRKTLRNSSGLVDWLVYDTFQRIPKAAAETWNAFAIGLKQRYGNLYDQARRGEESFVHAATAIRHGDIGTIAHFGAVDTDVEHVYEAVQAIAGELRNRAGEMAPGASKNFVMDRLGFLEGISGVDRYKAIKQAAEQMFSDLGGDPETILHEAQAESFKSYTKMFDAAEDKLEGRAFAPNYTAWAEAAGARHALYPSQMPPGRTPLPMPEQGIEDGWHFVGPAALWEKIAPTFSYINYVDKKLNAKYGVKGTNLPLADKAKAVDEAYRAGETWLNSNRQSAVQFLEGGKKKLETYGFMMTKQLKDWGGLAQKLQLDNDDLMRLKQAREWLTAFQADTNVSVMNYLQEIQPKLANHGYDVERVFPTPVKGSSMSTFHRLITTGELNPRDLHLGRLVNVFLREGMEKKFTGDALKEFQKVIDHKVDGKYALGILRPPLQRYAEYMKGIPDNGGRMINRFVGDLAGGINKIIEGVNKHLPEGFKASPIDSSSGDIIRKTILLNYVSSLGLRPAIAIRDGLQGLGLSMPIIGAKAFAKGVGLAITKEHWALAEESGALLKGKNIAEVFGDIYQDTTPAKGGLVNRAIDATSMLLAPSRWGHNFARRTVFAGTYDTALKASKSLRSLDKLDKASIQKFLDNTGLWFADEARQKQLISLASDKFVSHKEVAKQIALEMLDLTLWPYRRGTQPGFLKTGMGRVFGQYGLWPMSFLDYTRRLVSKVQENPRKALPALATFIATNYGMIHEARKHMGVDVSRWFMFSPAGYAGGPALELTADLMKSFKEDKEGIEARKRVLEYPLNLVPAFNEFKAIEETWDKPWINEEGHVTPDGYKVMGFRMQKPGEPNFDQVLGEDITPGKWLEHETGMKDGGEYGKTVKSVKKAYDKVTK